MLDASAALDESTGRLVVDGGKGANVADELLQQCGFDQIRLLGDQGLLGQHHLLGGHRVGGEQAPVDVTSVSEIWVVGVLWKAEQSQELGEGVHEEVEEDITCPQISSEAHFQPLCVLQE